MRPRTSCLRTDHFSSFHVFNGKMEMLQRLAALQVAAVADCRGDEQCNNVAVCSTNIVLFDSSGCSQNCTLLKLRSSVSVCFP